MRGSAARCACAALAALLLSGCTLTYLGSQALGQLRLLQARRPVEEVLADPATPAETRRTLRQIADVKAWGERELGLARTASYRHWVDTGGRPVSWLLTACPPDSLEPRTWWFPVVGSVPYLGFFREEDARAERDRQERAGYEVWVRPVLAYSMLGIVGDPVFSCFAEGEIHDVANTILHETTHATVWIPGSAAFNESLADFVGREGARRWMNERFGEGSPEVARAREAAEDAARFRRLILEARDELAGIFALDLRPWERRALRDALIARHRQRYRDAAPEFHSPRFRRFHERQWNTAMFAGFSVYHGDEALWDALLAANGGDLRAFLAAVKEAAAEPDPRAGVEQRARGGR